MSKPQRLRIERAICQMFDVDRAFNAKLKELPMEIQGSLDYPGCCEIALRLIGMPEDNWGSITQEEEYQAAKKTRVLISWDGLYDAWVFSCPSGKEFIVMCRQWIKDHAEECESRREK